LSQESPANTSTLSVCPRIAVLKGSALLTEGVEVSFSGMWKEMKYRNQRRWGRWARERKGKGNEKSSRMIINNGQLQAFAPAS
jgi:hypothetical protein